MIPNEHLLNTPGHAGVMIHTNDESVNYGSKRVENGNAIYWTGKGLAEAHPQNPNEQQQKLASSLKAKDEKELIASGHIAVTPLSKIKTVLR